MADAEAGSKMFLQLKGATEALIKGETVDVSVVKDPRRLMTYLRNNNIKGVFLLRCVWKSKEGSYSRAGKYIVEGVKFPKIMYVPPSDEEASRKFENLLGTPEKPIRASTLRSVAANAYSPNSPSRYRSVDRR
jgi:hypothetical protein